MLYASVTGGTAKWAETVARTLKGKLQSLEGAAFALALICWETGRRMDAEDCGQSRVYRASALLPPSPFAPAPLTPTPLQTAESSSG